MKTKLPFFGAVLVGALALFTASACARAQAVYNYAMSFRGVNDYVRIPDARRAGPDEQLHAGVLVQGGGVWRVAGPDQQVPEPGREWLFAAFDGQPFGF